MRAGRSAARAGAVATAARPIPTSKVFFIFYSTPFGKAASSHPAAEKLRRFVAGIVESGVKIALPNGHSLNRIARERNPAARANRAAQIEKAGARPAFGINLSSRRSV